MNTEASSNQKTAADGQLVQLQDVTIVRGEITLIADVSLGIEPGQIVSIVGPNGGGKTTLLKTITGVCAPSSGTVTMRPGLTIGYQPQRTEVHAGVPLQVRTLLELDAQTKDHQLARQCAEDLKLPASIFSQQVATLSGSERQRVMIARAMLARPQLLILDEPGTYCDHFQLSSLYQYIERYTRDSSCTTIVVSHDISRVMNHSDQVVCIDKRILCRGGPEQISSDTEFEAIYGKAGHTGIFNHEPH